MLVLVGENEAKFAVDVDSGNVFLVDRQTQPAGTGCPTFGDGMGQEQVTQACAAESRVRATTEAGRFVTFVPAPEHGVSSDLSVIAGDIVAIPIAALQGTQARRKSLGQRVGMKKAFALLIGCHELEKLAEGVSVRFRDSLGGQVRDNQKHHVFPLTLPVPMASDTAKAGRAPRA